MAGYNYMAGMSNNAVAAYDNGLLTASKIRNIPAKLIEEYVTPSEWHHTAKFYNRTNFYNPQEVRVIFGLEAPGNSDYEPNELAIAALAAYKASAKKAKAVTVWENCKVEWLEWSGSRSHPRATEMVRDGCRVELKDGTTTYKITYSHNGTEYFLTKRKGTNGFAFWNSNGTRVE
jgi:hypothetical protein